ncbi:hypothetical protein [Dyella japonica]|uniref:hypothetical protein n=1 Tax=Dyella japonica TaxID=231455 RepID=UPI001186F94C|nr:hypothetical protein [Dyella japonica]
MTKSLVCCVAALVSGCAIFGGDKPIHVMGLVPVQSSAEQSSCFLTMFHAESNQPASSRAVQAKFSTEFVVPAQAKPYYFVAKCQDGREYQSATIDAGGSGTYGKLFDLGTLAEK